MVARFIVRVSFVVLILLALPHKPVLGQIVITADDFPFHVGEHDFLALDTENADGENSAAIEALIALSGPDQFWDFRTIDFETEQEGTATISEGAVGPGSTDDLLAEASLTMHTPLTDPDSGLDGQGWLYLMITDEEARELGFVWHSDGTPTIGVKMRKAPAGDLVASFPVAFGSEWESEYTAQVSFTGIPLPPMEYDIEKSVEVDAWGMMHGPGLAEPVPVLRYKVTEILTVENNSEQVIYYEFYSTASVRATLVEPDDERPAQADFAVFGPKVVAADAQPVASRSALGAPFPNPASGLATFQLTLAEAAPVTVAVYDVLGREVVHVTDGIRAAGSHYLAIDTSALPAGLYVIRAEGRQWSESRRLTVIR